MNSIYNTLSAYKCDADANVSAASAPRGEGVPKDDVQALKSYTNAAAQAANTPSLSSSYSPSFSGSQPSTNDILGEALRKLDEAKYQRFLKNWDGASSQDQDDYAGGEARKLRGQGIGISDAQMKALINFESKVMRQR